MIQPHVFYTLEEAADLLRVSLEAVMDLLESEQAPAVKMNRHLESLESDMTKRRKERRVNGFACPPSITIKDAVPHPRYGNTVVTTPWATTREVVLNSFWDYQFKTFFPESAIPANVELQNRGWGERPYYVDILNRCVACGRQFLFFAREQQHIFEVLKFHIRADFTRCPECRKSMHRIKAALRRYGELIHHEKLTDDELKQLAIDVAALYEAGAIQDEQRLRTIKNLAVKRIPNTEATKCIKAVVERIDVNQV